MLRLVDPSEAVALAHDLTHREMADPGHPVISVGIDFGPAESRGQDWFEATVNMASRIAALAGAGEVVVSQAVRDGGGSIAPLSYEPLGSAG